jgi:photosystem II stability/assembly factor-like uncharacterized protein
MAVETPQKPTEHVPAVQPEIDAGVIEDARKRQRRQRLGGAALAAAVIVTGGLILLGGGGSGRRGAARHGHGGDAGSAATSHAAVPVAAAIKLPPNIGESGLLAPGVGWGVNGLGFFITRHGGRSWETVDVPGLGVGGDTIADLGYVVTPTSKEIVLDFGGNSLDGTCADLAPGQKASRALGGIAVSTDAGRTWHTHSLWCALAGSLSFVGAGTGFAVIHPSLYETTDAGRHWTRVAPAPDWLRGVAFANTRDGWGMSATVSGYPFSRGALHRTTDGGRTWRNAQICSGKVTDGVAVTCQIPTVLGKQHAVAPAFVVDRQAKRYRLLIYTTGNGGLSWQAHSVPVGAGLSSYVQRAKTVAFSAPNAHDLFVFVSPYLYRSVNGGRTWSRTAFSKRADVESIDFASPTYGWLNESLGKPGEGFEYTTDAGRTWEPIGTH